MRLSFVYCGLRCEKCPVHIATINDDDTLRAQIAEDWSKNAQQYWGKDYLAPEEVNCRGCRTEGDDIFISCKICPIRRCCREKELENCSYCGEFDSCKWIAQFFKENPDARSNMEANMS